MRYAEAKIIGEFTLDNASKHGLANKKSIDSSELLNYLHANYGDYEYIQDVQATKP